MAKEKTFYDILGIPENASLLEIKNHYHKLARLYHPDITKLENTHDNFIEINDAYRTLKDPILRKAYDFGLKQRRLKNDPNYKEEFRTGNDISTNVKENKVEEEQVVKPKTNKEIADLDLFVKKAKSCFVSNNLTEALFNIEEALKIDGNNFDMFKLRGDIYFKQENYDLAMESYSKACKINDSPEIRSLLSQVISLRNRHGSGVSGNKKKGFFGLF